MGKHTLAIITLTPALLIMAIFMVLEDPLPYVFWVGYPLSFIGAIFGSIIAYNFGDDLAAPMVIACLIVFSCLQYYLLFKLSGAIYQWARPKIKSFIRRS